MNNKKKILLIGIIIWVMLAAIIISAFILFRDYTKEGVHEGNTFTEKMTEGTTRGKGGCQDDFQGYNHREGNQGCYHG